MKFRSMKLGVRYANPFNFHIFLFESIVLYYVAATTETTGCLVRTDGLLPHIREHKTPMFYLHRISSFVA